MTRSGGSFPISPFGRPVALRERHQLQDVEGVLPAPGVLQHVLHPAPFSPHAVQGAYEVVLAELVLVAEEGTLLQGHRHGRPVFGTFTAGEPDAIQPPANRPSEP